MNDNINTSFDNMDFNDSDFEHFSGYDSQEMMESFHRDERGRLSGDSDSFLGIGKRNKEKKALKKERKAEKQLAKGHLKAAERKLGKAQKLLGQVESTQQKAISNEQKIQDINQNKQVLDQMKTQATESPDTSAGQIGAAASLTSTGSTPPPNTGGGGGGGDSSGIDSSGYFPDSSLQDTTAATADGEPIPKELPNVTVTNTPDKKPFPIMYVVIGLVVIAAIFYFLSKKK